MAELVWHFFRKTCFKRIRMALFLKKTSNELVWHFCGKCTSNEFVWHFGGKTNFKRIRMKRFRKKNLLQTNLYGTFRETYFKRIRMAFFSEIYFKRIRILDLYILRFMSYLFLPCVSISARARSISFFSYYILLILILLCLPFY